MLPGDTRDAAADAGRGFGDPRIHHFFDPENQAGKAIADSLHWAGQVARDTYLFYAQGQKWGDHPPPPADYAHQLTNAWADRDRLKMAGDLTDYLSLTAANWVRTK